MNEQTVEEEFVTLIAPSSQEIMDQFRAQGLGARGFMIAFRMAHHRLSLVHGSDVSSLFGGEEMIVATFSRRIPG
jgi:hypothetical protein